jgi:tetratricopeptide (TPR) repeat protein
MAFYPPPSSRTSFRVRPNLVVLRNERCWARTIVGDLAAALNDCNAAIQLTTDDAAPFDSRGLTYLKMGQWDSAIADYNSALRINPKLPTALYGRGLAELKKGNSAGSSSDITAAKTADSNIVDEFSHYGVK